ncbi:MAG: hypothetical protein MZV49_10335 [Rhodopseudomonas palustris]|nr:hypothetical protein [Rhodopseudomonas palustris]
MLASTDSSIWLAPCASAAAFQAAQHRAADAGIARRLADQNIDHHQSAWPVAVRPARRDQPADRNLASDDQQMFGVWISVGEAEMLRRPLMIEQRVQHRGRQTERREHCAAIGGKHLAAKHLIVAGDRPPAQRPISSDQRGHDAVVMGRRHGPEPSADQLK